MSFSKVTRLTLSLFLFAFIFFAFYRPLETEDVWWHLATGRWIWEHQQVPREDLFPPFTNVVQPWVFTQWLGSSILYGVYLLGGFDGMIAWRAVVFCGIGATAFFYGLKRVPFTLLVVLVFSMMEGLTARFVIRPCIYNLLFIQFSLIALFTYWRDRNLRCLLWLPLMGVIWSNLNLGSFIYGILLIGIFLAAAVAQAFDRNRQRGRAAWAPARDLFLTLTAYLLAFFVNPYGLQGFLYPFRVVFDPEFIHFYQFNSVIHEMSSPLENLRLLRRPDFISLFFLDVTALVLLYRASSGRAKDPGAAGRTWPGRAVRAASGDTAFPCLLLAITALGLVCYGWRGIGFFSIVSVYVIMQAGENFAAWSRPASRFPGRAVVCVFRMGLIVILAAGCRGALNKTIVIDGKHRRLITRTVAVNNPDAAFAFLRAHRLTGPVLHDDSIGGYMIWSLYPEWRPFIDGRQLNFPYFRKYLKLSARFESFWPLAQRDFGFRVAVLDAAMPDQEALIRSLMDVPDWRLVFIRGTQAVLAQKGHGFFPEGIDRLEEALGASVFREDDIRLMRRLIERHSSRGGPQAVTGKTPVYFQGIEEGILLYDLGFRAAGMNRIQGVLKKYPSPHTALIAKIALMKFTQGKEMPDHDLMAAE